MWTCCGRPLRLSFYEFDSGYTVLSGIQEPDTLPEEITEQPTRKTFVFRKAVDFLPQKSSGNKSFC